MGIGELVEMEKVEVDHVWGLEHLKKWSKWRLNMFGGWRA